MNKTNQYSSTKYSSINARMQKPATKFKQHGSMLVMSLFVIIVVSLLGAALIKMISASSNSTIHQVYGLRAQQAAKSGIEELLSNSFNTSGDAISCDISVASPASFSTVKGLVGCSYQARCATQTISFSNIDRLHYQLSSTGSCQIADGIVSRTLSVDAMQEITP